MLLNPAEIRIISDSSKVYDGTAVSDPEIFKKTDSENVVYTYYDVTNNVGMGSEVPVKAGTYTVKASVAETDLYTAAESEAKEFIIEKRSVVLKITGEEIIDGDVANARITVEVSGMESVPMDEGAAITLYVSEDSGEYIKVSTEAVKTVDGSYIAEFDFTRATAGKYLVKAVFDETENFKREESDREFNKESSDPEEPAEPSEPENPTDSSDSSETEIPDGETQMADNFNLMLWMMIMLIAGALCMVAGMSRSKR